MKLIPVVSAIVCAALAGNWWVERRIAAAAHEPFNDSDLRRQIAATESRLNEMKRSIEYLEYQLNRAVRPKEEPPAAAFHFRPSSPPPPNQTMDEISKIAAEKRAELERLELESRIQVLERSR